MFTISSRCLYVRDGGTFRTSGDIWVRLARVRIPEEGESGYDKAKSILESLILSKPITYRHFGIFRNCLVAEVWCGGENANDAMIGHGYG